MGIIPIILLLTFIALSYKFDKKDKRKYRIPGKVIEIDEQDRPASTITPDEPITNFNEWVKKIIK